VAAALLIGSGIAATVRWTQSSSHDGTHALRLSILHAFADADANDATDARPLRRSRPSALRFQAVRPVKVGRLAAGSAPTFGQPTISGVGGFGFEADLRLDPSNSSRIYTSVPGTGGADTSWIWRSLDGGKTFKWVPSSAPLNGKVTPCVGGGDTELAVDGSGRLYFNDLSLANFSTARSDDFGSRFTCSNTGVPDAGVDRQWYALDGDPTAGGSLYLTNDEVGNGS